MDTERSERLLLDNKNHGRVKDALKAAFQEKSKISVLTSLFSIYGFKELRAELRKCSSAQILLGNIDAIIPQSLAGLEEEFPLRAELDMQRIAAECTKWLSEQVDVKGMEQGPPHNLFGIQNDDQNFVVSGTSNFTAPGLGVLPSKIHALNTKHENNSVALNLLKWFGTVWDDPAAAQDVKDKLLENIEALAADKPANQIYFLTLFNLFRDFIEDLEAEKIIRTKTGFKDTLIWNKLYKFQRDGVIGAIDKLERYNGCIIADSVGLGKTFEALAVIKYYELRNDRVLVLAPKKLRENWAVYTVNDKRNLLTSDRFNYDVLNHTDLSRSGGISGEINLETLNWSNYDLVVIDESHNFRNNNRATDRVTRYERLMNEVIRSGVKTKVLLLSATPVNSRLNDLKNQVAFITEGQDDALADVGLSSINLILSRAQGKFNKWLKLPEDARTTEALLQNLNFGYFKLLDLLTIARSRRHIERYYDTAEIGKFPNRLRPQNIKIDIDLEGRFPALKDVNRSIKRLSLAAYAPLDYVRSEKQAGYSERYDKPIHDGQSTWKQVDRERSLVNLMRVNLLKRMESSIHSFALTVGKLHNLVGTFLQRIEEHGTAEIEELSIEDFDTEAPELADFAIGKKVKVLIQDLDLHRIKQDLAADYELLGQLLEDAQQVTSVQDAKLSKLKETIADKISKPINSGNRKVVVFTAFADTAEYLYTDIQSWAQQKFGLQTALVTGSGRNKCTIKNLPRNLNNILTWFSPVSKERASIDPNATEDIDILIATDCISEGQNLQDCDMLINYDIHWNPVRIIQRFGRVDRLGSTNHSIQLTNFWPNMELDEYINLEARVSGRMVLLDISATGEENVIDYDESRQMNDLAYRRKQMKQLQETVIDLEDMDGNVSITDMTLNDFRMDLSGYMADNFATLEAAPCGYHSVITAPNAEFQSGALFCLRDVTGSVMSADTYALAPYFLVYVSDEGDIIFNHLQAKKSLDVFKKLAATTATLDQNAIDALATQTRSLRDMSHYQHLRDIAIASIIGKNEEKGVESLFHQGGTTLASLPLDGARDFEVVTFFIIKAAA